MNKLSMRQHLAFASRTGRAILASALLAAAGAAHAAPVEVPVAKARVQAMAAGFEFDGVVEPVTKSTVAAQAGGRIARLAVKAGDRVRAGQVLATIDDRETRTGLQRSQAHAAQAAAEYRNARAQYERTRELQSKGFVSKAALDTAQAAFDAAQAGRDEAAAGQRQSAIAQGFTQVTAPYDGSVLETLAESGDLAVPGKPLLTLYAPLPLRVVVHVPASRRDAARAASEVEVRVDGGSGKGQWITPAARTMLPAADPVAQTLEWRLELPPAAARDLAPGQQVHVRFSGGTQQRLVVPVAAVLRRGELTAVYVAAPGGGFVLKAVRLGADHGTAGVEVLAGLAGSELVALDPVKAGLAGARPALAP
jgi:RND family efflux transporter MFP subunit